jgi:hypothetical protein
MFSIFILYVFPSFAERQKARVFSSFCQSTRLGFRLAGNLAEQPLRHIFSCLSVCPSVRLSVCLSVGTHVTNRELLNGLP